MAVVAVDWVGATRHIGSIDDAELIEWQRWLVDALRQDADRYDGRHLKLLGDGCLTAFEDPRAALDFAAAVHEHGPFRIGIAVGLVEDVGGELAGRTVLKAYTLMRRGGAGDTQCCPLTQAICQRVT